MTTLRASPRTHTAQREGRQATGARGGERIEVTRNPGSPFLESKIVAASEGEISPSQDRRDLHAKGWRPNGRPRGRPELIVLVGGSVHVGVIPCSLPAAPDLTGCPSPFCPGSSSLGREIWPQSSSCEARRWVRDATSQNPTVTCFHLWAGSFRVRGQQWPGDNQPGCPPPRLISKCGTTAGEGHSNPPVPGARGVHPDRGPIPRARVPGGCNGGRHGCAPGGLQPPAVLTQARPRLDAGPWLAGVRVKELGTADTGREAGGWRRRADRATGPCCPLPWCPMGPVPPGAPRALSLAVSHRPCPSRCPMDGPCPSECPMAPVPPGVPRALSQVP